ncbi:uncharacterized protein CLBA1 [Peromyscus californicus insignis]|uniref:uncharacterized protein CLBA1 n=1 Tax=Peromyscus californicus insignis TaxID=564181 RepID=UPI0022A71D14|nr:uncharacterized protein CLBA1 [Peromyscus californicus insignis]
MQGGQEVRREAVSDLAQEPGEGSLHQTAGGQSGDGLERRRICCDGPLTPLPDAKASSSRLEEGLPACTLSCPHPGELSGGWGEFEGFRESSAKSEQFSQSFELLGRAAEHQPLRTPSIPKEHGSCQVQQGGPWVTGTAAGPSSESILSYEKVFRFAFQEVPVERATEDICSLDHFLEISSEENAGLASVPRLCSESRKLWRALQNTDTASASQRLWSESHCWENLFPVLGVDAAQKSLSGGQGHVLEGSDLRKPEELLAVSSFRLHHCKALIQTKLSGTSGSRQGSLITYSLFLKTPLQGNGHYITIPQKKIFTPRNLKMAFFNNDVC